MVREKRAETRLSRWIQSKHRSDGQSRALIVSLPGQDVRLRIDENVLHSNEFVRCDHDVLLRDGTCLRITDDASFLIVVRSI